MFTVCTSAAPSPPIGCHPHEGRDFGLFSSLMGSRAWHPEGTQKEFPGGLADWLTESPNAYLLCNKPSWNLALSSFPSTKGPDSCPLCYACSSWSSSAASWWFSYDWLPHRTAVWALQRHPQHLHLAWPPLLAVKWMSWMYMWVVSRIWFSHRLVFSSGGPLMMALLGKPEAGKDGEWSLVRWGWGWGGKQPWVGGPEGSLLSSELWANWLLFLSITLLTPSLFSAVSFTLQTSELWSRPGWASGTGREDSCLCGVIWGLQEVSSLWCHLPRIFLFFPFYWDTLKTQQ